MSRSLGRVAVRLAVLVLAGGMSVACSATDVPPLTPREVPTAAMIDPTQPCVRQADLAVGVAGSGTAPPAATPVQAAFDPAAGVIRVTRGQNVTLPALAKAVGSTALREVAPGRWLLGANLEILPGASMRVAAPEVTWLQLRSQPGRFVTLKVLGGGLDVQGSCVTSWDPAANSAVVTHEGGRSFLLARDGGQMRIDHAELRYLGHSESESYGLAWRTAGTGGAITNSVVSHLWFGLYSYEVDGLVVADSEFHDNALYGIDPHTGSRNLVIERNVVHDNGKHGIILAEDCTDSVIRDNVVYRNAHHGIVLYQRSDRNIVENNETFRNAAQGIDVNESAENVVRGNRVYQNDQSGISVGQTSARNLVEGNDIRANGQDGMRLVSEAAENEVVSNIIGGNARYGVYIDGDGGFEITDNTIFGNRVGVVTKNTDQRPGNNEMHDNRDADVLAR